MFRFTKRDGSRTQFGVKNVAVGNSAESEYTRFQIYTRSGQGYEYATVFVWDVLPLKDKDKVEILEIMSMDIKPVTYHSSQAFQVTLSAKVKIVGDTTDDIKPIEVEGSLVPNFAEQEMPF